MLYHERLAKKKGFSVIIGVDEAGRGPLAGPVVVAAVCLKKFSFRSRIDDSKKLTVLQRRRAFAEIIRNAAYGIGVAGEGAIDSLNITAATRLAADAALKQVLGRMKRPCLTRKNTFLLFDATLCSSFPFPSKEIIGGDGKSLSIASASVIAKVLRDKIMELYDQIYPQYAFRDHKGYGTRKHSQAIARFGLCPIHRRTFCSHFS